MPQITQVLKHFPADGYGIGLKPSGILTEFLPYYQKTYALTAGDTGAALIMAIEYFDISYACLIANAVNRSNDIGSVFSAANNLAQSSTSQIGDLSANAVIIAAINNYKPVMTAIAEQGYSEIFTPIATYRKNHKITMGILPVAITKLPIKLLNTAQIEALIRKFLAEMEELEEQMRKLLRGAAFGYLRHRLTAMLAKLGSSQPLDFFDEKLLQFFLPQPKLCPVAAQIL